MRQQEHITFYFKMQDFFLNYDEKNYFFLFFMNFAFDLYSSYAIVISENKSPRVSMKWLFPLGLLFKMRYELENKTDVYLYPVSIHQPFSLGNTTDTKSQYLKLQIKKAMTTLLKGG